MIMLRNTIPKERYGCHRISTLMDNCRVFSSIGSFQRIPMI